MANNKQRISPGGLILKDQLISINRVTRLSHEEFAEREESRLVPSKESGLLGQHTINRAGDLSVVDVFARARKF